jgi:hypothetical protein
MRDTLRMILFVVILGTLLSAVILLVNAYTAPRIAKNAELTIKRNVLDAQGIAYGQEDLELAFDRSIDVVRKGEKTYYVLKNGDVAFEFVDAVLNDPPGRLEAICREIIRRKLELRLRTMGINPAHVTGELLDLMRRARVDLTDSGGIQEETTALGIPCITLRDNTERPVTVSLGTNYLVGTNERKIRAAFAAALAGGRPGARMPPFWDGKAAERIVDVILHEAAGRLFIQELLLAFVASLLAAGLLSMSSTRVLSRYSRKVLFIVCIGLLLAAFGDLSKFGIGGYPASAALLTAVSFPMIW